MVADRLALDAMSMTVQRWKKEGGTVYTDELQKLAGDNYTIHSGSVTNHRSSEKIKHRFGAVLETNGHFYVAVGAVGERWVMADDEGKTIVERYAALREENDRKAEDRKSRKPSTNRKPRGYWTKERVLEVASHYKSRSEFRINEKSAYLAASKFNMLHLLP